MTRSHSNGSTNGKGSAAKAETKPIRCAIYTRKSTNEGLDQDFNTLDAQREAAELYIKSQAGLGWTIVPTHYDDGGFTGGNLERPALQRLMDDIERNLVDVVVVYKVDRLSRSLLDFSRLVERFDKRGIGFVSITQHFDTSTSMGRLVLNILLSFAQFERELISERTRDKIQGAKRRGKWTGGQVGLGYRIDPDKKGLVVVPEDAELVRLVFDTYLRTLSVGRVASELNDLGYRRKRHVTKDGRAFGGQRWNKVTVHQTLRNPLYIGKIKGAGDQLYLGEHEPVVSLDVFTRANEALDLRSTGKVRISRRPEYLLTGLLRCGPCESAMTSSVARGRTQRYRYYRCVRAEKENTKCPTGLLRANEIEEAVIAQVRDTARRDDLRVQVRDRLFGSATTVQGLRAAQARHEARVVELGAEAKRLLAAFTDTSNGGGKILAERLGEIEAEQDRVRAKAEELASSVGRFDDNRRRGEQLLSLLESFDELWGALVQDERRQLLHLLVERVTIDLASGGMRIAFHMLDSVPEAPREACA